MKIEKNKMVSITYELHDGAHDGELIENVKEDHPFTFLYDSGKLLKEFEKSLEGKKTGEDFECILTPDQAYGDYHEDRIIDISIKAFEIEGEVNPDIVAVGKTVPMLDNNGNKFYGYIMEINDDKVKMDFNHPMAGKTLAFKGKVIEVRDATEQELNAHLYGHDASSCSTCNSDCGH
ncbi:MAG: FKBP-type peptidyl-prolyl cis-trans isomerase [Marinilabiliales bacterium]